MSIYTEISKRVGWDSKAIKLPTLAHANLLLKGVKDGKSYAFEQVLRFNRFAPSPQNNREREVNAVVTEAYQEGIKLFHDANYYDK